MRYGCFEKDLCMKKILFYITLLLSTNIAVRGQEDPGLKKRLDVFLEANQQLDFEKIMDFTYPKIFSLVPREQLTEFMKSAFNTPELTIRMDSLKIIRIHPVFSMGGASYAKVNYSMLLFMTPHGEEKDVEKDQEAGRAVADGMKQQFGAENVSYDSSTNTIRIYNRADMIAVKDELSKDWSFLNLRNSDPIMEKLFPADVLKQLSTYQ